MDRERFETAAGMGLVKIGTEAFENARIALVLLACTDQHRTASIAALGQNDKGLLVLLATEPAAVHGF